MEAFETCSTDASATVGTASTVRRVSSCPRWMARSVAMYRYRPETNVRVTMLLSQLMQGVLHCDVQSARQFMGEIPARGTIDKHFGGGQQRAERENKTSECDHSPWSSKRAISRRV